MTAVDSQRFDESVAEQALLEHQFHATRKTVATTPRAAGPGGDRRGGVVWHTQGSGKSLTMAFFCGKLVTDPALANPTLVVLTDRNDLDDQLSHERTIELPARHAWRPDRERLAERFERFRAAS